MSRSWLSRGGCLAVTVALLSLGLASAPMSAATDGYPAATAHYVITVAPWVHRWTLAFDCTGTTFTGTGGIDGVPGSEETIEGTVSGGYLAFHSRYTGTDNPGFWWRATFAVGGGPLSDMTTSQGQGFEASAVLVETWPDSRPDARISLVGGRVVGDDIYNATGARQSRASSAHRGGTVTFRLSIQNDGDARQCFGVKGSGSTSGYRVRYLRGTTDITGPVVAGTYRTPRISPDSAYSLKVVVTVRSNADIGSYLSRRLTVWSSADDGIRDAVRLIVTAVGRR
jgi:hypothetical protein